MSDDNSQGRPIFAQTSEIPEALAVSASAPTGTATAGKPSVKTSKERPIFQQTSETPAQPKAKEPGILDTANAYYEGRPAIPMAPTTEYASNLLHRIGSSLGRTAMIVPNTAAGVVHAVVDEPTLDDAGLSVQGRITKRLLVDPSLQAIEKEKEHEEADKAVNKPHSTTEKVLNRAVSAVPLIGPFVESEGQRAGRGDIAGAATDVGAMTLIPEVAKEAGPGGRLPGAAAKGEAAFPTVGKVADIANSIKVPALTDEVRDVLIDEAKQYGLRKIPLYDVVKTAKRIASKISDLKEAETAEAAPEELKPIGSKVAEPASELKPIGSRAKSAKLEEELNRALGNEPLKRNVPLKDQGKPAETAEPEPEHLGQHARANGKWVNELSEKDRAKVHDLSNVEVRQLAVNLGEDMGQKTVGRGKLRGEGSITREEVFNRLLKNHTPAEVVKAIDAGKHLPKK